MNNDRSLLDEAKRRVPLSLAADRLGLPKLRPNGTQRSPLREDRHASFSVTNDTLWNDFSTGEGGDVVSFVMAASGCNHASAINAVIAMAGLERGGPLPAPLPRRPSPPPPPKRDLLTGLRLRQLTIDETARIIHARGWPVFAGLALAEQRGLLFACDSVPHRGGVFPSWILTDNARKTGMARRLDGQKWTGPDGEGFKSLSLRSEPEAPIGLADVVENDRKIVLLAEGDPDFLAAINFAWFADMQTQVGVIRLDGNCRALNPVVAQALRGRRVRILVQHDNPRSNGKQPALDFARAWATALEAEQITADAAMAEPLRPKTWTGDFDFADLLATPGELEMHEAHACTIMEGLTK